MGTVGLRSLAKDSQGGGPHGVSAQRGIKRGLPTANGSLAGAAPQNQFD